MSMSVLFCSILVAGIALTILARNTHDILLRIGASLCWLALLIYLLIGGDATLDMGNNWIRVLAFAFLVMVVVPLTWQMKTDIRHEASVRGEGGLTGQSQSYTAFEKKPKKKKFTGSCYYCDKKGHAIKDCQKK